MKILNPEHISISMRPNQRDVVFKRTAYGDNWSDYQWGKYEVSRTNNEWSVYRGAVSATPAKSPQAAFNNLRRKLLAFRDTLTKELE